MVLRFDKHEHEKLRFTFTVPEEVTGFAVTGCVDFEVSEALFGGAGEFSFFTASSADAICVLMPSRYKAFQFDQATLLTT